MTEMFHQDKIEELLSLTDNCSKIVIITHINPDGDAIGSSVAWQTFLKERGKEVEIIVPNHFPDFLKWIKGSENIQVYCANREKCENILKNADILFCLDFNNLSRLDALGNFLKTLNIKKILIDHHTETKESNFDLVFSQVPSSSTSELVYKIITGITGQRQVSLFIAEALYAGIMTDTGVFSHSTDSGVFRIVAELMDCGIDFKKIHSLVYNNFSEYRMRLMAYSIFNKMEVLPEYNTAVIHLTRQELEQFKFEAGDTEGFVNIPLSIKNIVLSAFFVESREGFIKLSLRSVGEFSVDKMSRKYFNGGGHKNAAGGRIFVSLDEAVAFFKSVLPEFENELKIEKKN